MTYCVAMRLRSGLLFASDTRTNAGIDHIASFRKMYQFQIPHQREIVVLTAGNLATTQSVMSVLNQRLHSDGEHLLNVPSLYDAAALLGRTLKEIINRDSHDYGGGVDFGANMLIGGQILGEGPRLFHVYPQGNFIEATEDTPYFQIGESKYGKPILDRVLTPTTPLDEAAKCALVSMDSTLKSNLSVGLPLDLLVYEEGSLQSQQIAVIDDQNPYFRMIRGTWGQRLREVFEAIDDPHWDGAATAHPLLAPSERFEPLRKISHPGERIV